MIRIARHPGIREGAASAAARLRAGRFLPRGWRHLWLQVGVMAVFALLYEATRVVVRGDRHTALVHAHAIVDRERSLGLFVEPDIQHWALHAPSWVIDVANYTYLNCQFTLSFSVLLWVYLRRNDAFARLRNTILAVDALGVLGYMIYPAAPPRMLHGLGFVDTLDQASVNHHSGPVAALANPYAAMPSLHTAYALVIGITVASLVRSRVLRALWLLYPGLVVFAIIATANHFVFDAMAGATVAVLAATGTRVIQRAAGRGHTRGLLMGGALASGLGYAAWRLAGHAPAVLDAVRPAAPLLLGAALAANLASVLLKASVWKLALQSAPGVGRVRHRTLVPSLFIGFLCNSVFVLRVGDVARIADARRRLRAAGTPVSTAAVAGSAIAEQLVLGSALVVLGFGFALTVAAPPAWIWLSLAAAAALIGGVVVAVGRAPHWRPAPDRAAGRLAGAALAMAGESRHLLRDRRALALAGAAGLASWAFQIAGIWVLLRAFGLPDSAVPVAAVFLASTTVGLVPLVPGNIGVFPAAVAAALSGAGVGVGDGAAFGLGLQAVEFALGAGLGLVFACGSGMALRDLTRREPRLELLEGGRDEPNGDAARDRLAA